MKQRKAVSDVSKAKGMSNDVSSNNEFQSSVNSDWKHWLVLHGNDKAMYEDV